MGIPLRHLCFTIIGQCAAPLCYLDVTLRLAACMLALGPFPTAAAIASYD